MPSLDPYVNRLVVAGQRLQDAARETDLAGRLPTLAAQKARSLEIASELSDIEAELGAASAAATARAV